MAKKNEANEEAPVTEKVTVDMLRSAYREAMKSSGGKENEKTEKSSEENQEVTTDNKSVEGSGEANQEQEQSTVQSVPQEDAQQDTSTEEKSEEGQPVDQPAATQPTEAKKPVDNSESSRLGRKLAKLEAERQKDSETLNAILQRLEKLTPGETQEIEEDGVPEVITTPEDVYKAIEVREKKEREAKEFYHNAYAENVDTYESLNRDIHNEVINEMLSNQKFNMVITGNPAIDAKINYTDAKAALLSKKLAVKEPKKVPVKGEAPIAATGLSGTSKVTAPKTETPNLDDLSKRFLSKIGKSEEWAGKVLSENQ